MRRFRRGSQDNKVAGAEAEAAEITGGAVNTTKVDGAEAEAAEVARGAAKTTKVDGAEAEAAGDDKTLRASFTNKRGRGAAGDGKSEGESQLAITRKRERAAACAHQWGPWAQHRLWAQHKLLLVGLQKG